MGELSAARVAQRHRKRAMLLMSEGNPLWARLGALETLAQCYVRAAAIDQDTSVSNDEPVADDENKDSDACEFRRPSKSYEHLGVSRQTADNWRNGVVAKPASLHRQTLRLSIAVRNVSRKLVARHAGKAPSDLDQQLRAFARTVEDDAPVLESGRALGLRDDATRKLIDQAFDRIHPLFDLPYSVWVGKAEEVLSDLDGTHQVWLFREDRILKCALRFRYVVQLRGGYAIKVKLNVPIARPTPDQADASAGPEIEHPHVDYDGWLMHSQPSRLFLSFETRNAGHRSDMLHMIIEGYRTNPTDRRGHYLTVDQDNAMSIVAGRLLMAHSRSPAKTPDEGSTSEFMRSALAVIERDQAQFEELQRRLDSP